MKMKKRRKRRKKMLHEESWDFPSLYVFYVHWNWLCECERECVTSLNIQHDRTFKIQGNRSTSAHKIIRLFSYVCMCATFFVWWCAAVCVNKFPENRREILRFVHFRKKISTFNLIVYMYGIHYPYACNDFPVFFSLSLSFILSLDISYLPVSI